MLPNKDKVFKSEKPVKFLFCNNLTGFVYVVLRLLFSDAEISKNIT